MRVLIVDDEPGMRQLIRRFIRKDFDVEVIEADDGMTALDRLLTERVDLVLLDLSMRVMDGLETLEAIRRSQTYATLPVLLLTGHADEDRVRRALELGIAGLVVKPFTHESLRERLSKLLDARPHPDGAASAARALIEIPASSRALIVDQSPEFRAIATRPLSRICHVDESENEFVALRRCLSAPVDVIVVGSTSELSTPELFARKVRGTMELRDTKLVAAVPPAALEATRIQGWYDAVLVRSFVAETFERSLRRALGFDTLARLLLHPEAAAVVELFESVRRTLADALDAAVTVQDAPPAALGESRWVVGALEVQSGRLAWDLRLRCPLTVALELESARLTSQPDQVSEAQMIAAAGNLLLGFARNLKTTLQEGGLTVDLLEPRVSVQGSAGYRPAATEAIGTRRWFTTPMQQTVGIELAPLVTHP